jgi:hypothetical protein
MIQIGLNSKEYVTDDIYKYFLIENVESYSYHEYDSYLINNNNTKVCNNLKEKRYYLINDFNIILLLKHLFRISYYSTYNSFT